MAGGKPLKIDEAPHGFAYRSTSRKQQVAPYDHFGRLLIAGRIARHSVLDHRRHAEAAVRSQRGRKLRLSHFHRGIAAAVVAAASESSESSVWAALSISPIIKASNCCAAV